MNKNDAARLIQDTFENTFSKERFAYFVKNFLNTYDQSKAFPENKDIPDVYRQKIKAYERLGKYTDPAGKRIDILIVYLQKETSIDRARTAQRNFVAQYLKDRDEKDAGLIAFVSPNGKDWRFSFVKMEYKFVETANGTVKAKEHFTPAKRYSFLVGPQEASHTAQSRMQDIFLNDEINPTLEEIEDVFSVEKVTKEFFTKYKELFESVIAELESNHTFQNEAVKNNINTENFAKKLLGQIVFLYFLQKKGWLGVPKGNSWGEGDKNFLRSLFNKCIENNKNFYNDYLEILFYDTLNNPRRNEVDPSYSKFFESKVPFLNGGLFESPYNWHESLIYLDNKIFAQIFDVFDLYNFTVKEDEPLEKEVAVDPEMLGKVFENLLEENLRKGKGTYYTPREIVHYMCEESLISYLATNVGLKPDNLRNKYFPAYNVIEDKKFEARDVSISEKIIESLKNIKVVDPACGSGAFLVGMLQLITVLRRDLQTRSKLVGKSEAISTEYDIKKQTIQNCIYGVDIDPGAVEIAKLRLWLALVVDYDLEDIEPLPNLDYKIMVGNSLIEKLDANALSKTNDKKKNEMIDELKTLKDEFFVESEPNKKRQLRIQINELARAIINYDNKQESDRIWDMITNRKNQMKIFAFDDDQKTLADVSSYTKKLDQLKDLTETDHFEWHLNFNEVFEKGGFDIIIANPPYVRADSRDLKYQNFRKLLSKSTHYKTLYEKWDLFIPFIERGLNLLNDKGDLNFIVSNAVCTSKYAFKLLDLIQENYFIVSIDYFENILVFDAGVIPVVLHVSKNPINQPVKKILRNGSFDNIVSEVKYKSEDFKLLGKQGFKKDYHAINIKIPNYKLGGICYISKGMVLNSDENTNKGAFAKNDLISEVKTDINTKPYIEGKYIKKYLIEKTLFLEWNTKRVPQLLSRPTFPELYSRPKIMRGRVTEGTFDSTGLVSNDSILLFLRFVDLRGVNNKSIAISIQKFNSNSREKLEKISLKFDLKYLLAIINSKFANVFLNNIRRHRLENYFYPDDFRNLPIAELPLPKQKRFADLVDKIISLKKSSLEKDKQLAIDYENQIDQLVYKLYGLTLDEINVIQSYGHKQ